ncbi:MAG: hypothetical protein ACRC2O_12650 [Chitinophagaceae bacterium]
MKILDRIKLSGYGALFSICSLAQEKPPVDAGLGDAASNATNPLAFVTKLQVQPNFTWKEQKARQINVTSRIIQPTATIGLPFFKSKDPSKVYTIYRLELPLVSQTFPENQSMNGTGMADIILLDVVAFKKKWGLWGVGPGLIIPTMNPSQISSRKWAAGATGVYLNTSVKGIQWGALAEQFFSFGGDSQRPSQSFMLFQPIFNKILGHGNFIQFSPIMNFNWTSGLYNIPLSLALGKAFAKNLSATVAGEYVVSGPNQGDVTFKFQINAMFPPSKK